MRGTSDYKSIIQQLVDDGLTYNMVASALNISPNTVRRVDGRYPFKQIKKYTPKHKLLKKFERKSKIDRDKFIKLWQNGATYESIARVFGVTESTARKYKYKNCKGILRSVMCQNCGIVFKTDKYARAFCDACLVDSNMAFFRHKSWKKKLEEGTILLEKRRKAEALKKSRKELKKHKKIGERPDWWDS